MPLISGSCNSTSIILLTQSCATLQTNHCLFHSEVNKASGGALALINTSSPSSTLWVRCDPSTNMVPNCEFQRRCNWSPCLNIPLLRHCTSSLLGAFSIMCSRIRYCKSVDETFIGIPPAAAIAALNDRVPTIEFVDRMRHNMRGCLSTKGQLKVTPTSYEEPVAVETHMPEDQTFNEFWISYNFPPMRVTVP